VPVAPEAALRRFLDDVFRDGPLPRIGIAVSGGGDSMALLYLAQGWCAARGGQLHAATVNHGLRPEAAAEADMVAKASAALGVPHVTLHWQGLAGPNGTGPDGTGPDGTGPDGRGKGWTGQGNLQAAAREARRTLLTDWAGAQGLSAILLGHTADDQAETVLMRLARGSGVDGLAGMPPKDRTGLFLRPLLGVTRGDLRAWLMDRAIPWAEDPSNEDPRFDRVKARQLLAALEPLGLTRARLVETAAHMTRARETLWAAATAFVTHHLQTEAGDLLFDAPSLDLAQGDTPGRVLAAAVQWIGNAGYRPRHDSLTEAAVALRRGEARTLGGVRMQPYGAGGARLSRELAAAQTPVRAPSRPGARVVWDGRWLVSQVGGPAIGDLTVSALGEVGFAACPAGRTAGLPRMALLATPAIWQGEALVAAPLAGHNAQWTASLRLPFDRFIVSH